ncbi:hypothetical protein BOTBODRAFT_611936 [Botryobasidium botryosum FD-172 SS1]|uniref:F-box domain-containing protein n=1 Tax=Botryobasidium botryosum (strain FD-172 SS1) TaxID=930990 RepID=A0A067M6T5_BOTB1|nr:hypothetical protein BOTBODRAFT_611936 [Botryobasidium botryosum FD-172 SS1]
MEYALLMSARQLAFDSIRSCTARMISALNNRRNQKASVYRLPPEVLMIIFQFTECSSANPLRPLRKRAPLNVAAVSRRWRQVVLNTPGLWTRIDIMMPWLTQNFLERSKEAPLTIEVNAEELNAWASSGDGENEETHPAQSRLSRYIDFLKLTAPRWISMELRGVLAFDVVQAFSFPLPHLEVLRIIKGGDTLTSESYPLPNALFRGSAPCLRDLHLNATPISLKSPIFAGLTSLHLEKNTYHTCTIGRFIRVLAACPDLEDLVLISTRFTQSNPAHSSTPSTSPPLVLPHLQHIVLRGMAACVPKSILDSTSVPSSAVLDIDTLISSWDDAAMPANLPNASRVRSLSIGADREIEGSYRIAGKVSEGSAAILKVGYTVGSPLFFMGARVPNVLRHLGRGHSFSSLESLMFTGLERTPVDVSIFAEVVGNLPSITTLVLQSCPSSYLDALVISSRYNLCPGLRTLRLVRIPAYDSLLRLVESRARNHEGDAGGCLDALEVMDYRRDYVHTPMFTELERLVALKRTGFFTWD